MSAEIVNLNKFRKAKERAEKERQAEENRAKHGRSRVDRDREEDDRDRRDRLLDGSKRTGADLGQKGQKDPDHDPADLDPGTVS